nr:hypothetical protein HK105_003746 [Polyrhizophydium stewartii]
MLANALSLLSLIAVTASGLAAAAPLESNPLDNTELLIDLYNKQVGFSNAINKRSGVQVDQATMEKLQTYTQYTAAAYCPSVTSGLGWFCGGSCSGRTKDFTVEKAFTYLLGPQTAGYIGYNTRTKQIITAFRGSVTINNWLEDFMLWFQDADNGQLLPSFYGDDKIKLHKGFQESYRQARSLVRSTLASLMQRFPDYELIFTGHSLGAALAIVAATDIYQTTPSIAGRTSVYTYGQPRVGNTAWANYIDNLPFASRIYRVTGYVDVIPGVPFELPGLDYAHNKQQYTNQVGRTVKCDNNGGKAGETLDCNYPQLTIPGALDHVTGYFGFTTALFVC